MKRSKLKRAEVIAIAAAAVVSVCVGAAVIASAATSYDPANDPLVTKSYVDSYVDGKFADLDAAAKDTIRSKISSELESQLENTDIAKAVKDSIKDELSSEIRKDLEGAKLTADISYKSVVLEKGKRILAGGSCEMILTDGSATAVCVSGTVIDITDGECLATGDAIQSYHGIVAYADGSAGIMATSEATVLVRGDYEIA